MKKSPIYTRTGDKGMTSLVDGSRLAKNSVRIEAYGTVDELNSFIGVLIASDPLTDDDRALLTDIQARLFDIGSYLASGNAEMSERLRPRLDGAIEALEHVLDLYDSELPPMRSFVLPQGAPSAAAAHVARAVARRAERRILAFNSELAAHEVYQPPERLSVHTKPALQPYSRYCRRMLDSGKTEIVTATTSP